MVEVNILQRRSTVCVLQCDMGVRPHNAPHHARAERLTLSLILSACARTGSTEIEESTARETVHRSAGQLGKVVVVVVVYYHKATRAKHDLTPHDDRSLTGAPR